MHKLQLAFYFPSQIPFPPKMTQFNCLRITHLEIATVLEGQILQENNFGKF